MSRFETTKWSLVLAARESDDPTARAALAELCRCYWYPLFAFARRCTGRADSAADHTQGFFADLLERRTLVNVDPAAGRFRSFLLASFKNYLSHERERATAAKRGGSRPPISLDGEAGEARYLDEPRDEWTPEQQFERNWALALLARVSDRLREELEQAGKGREYRALAGFLTDDGGKRPYREVAADLGSTEAAVKMAIRRLRQRYGALLRDEIAQTVRDDADVDRELRSLLAALRPG
jgi:RNA polymerase sigma-70 factor (ECF subfamily)